MSRTERGFITDGWLIGILVVLLLSLIGGIAYTVKSTIENADERGYERGKTETEATYAKRDNDALKAANERIQALQNEARSLEAMRVAEVTAITDKLTKEKANDLAYKDRVIAGLRDGTTKLYVKLAGSAQPCAGSQAGETGPSTSGNTGTGASGILDESDSSFLINEASRADRIAGKLQSCQAVIRADRK